MTHARLTGPGPAGPVHANLLRCMDCRLTTHDLRAGGRTLVEAVSTAGAIAAVSGGYFLYSEPDICPPARRTDPVGLLVSDGVVHTPPWFRRATLFGGRSPHLATLGPVGCTLTIGPHRWTIVARNDPAASGPVLFTRAWGTEAPRDGLRLAGTTCLGPGREIPLLGGVLVDDMLPPLCGPVSWTLPGGPITEAMAGGPWLLGPGPVRRLELEDFTGTAPPITFSQDETYDQNLLPRMAAGTTDRGVVIFAAIDGRQFEQAPGFTLAMTGELMAALGCTMAMNLDGGSSKRMVVRGEVVDHPSTEVVASAESPTPVRPVHTAILVHP